jgi:hypothetical protein
MAKPSFDEANHPFEQKVRWTKTDDAEFPYSAKVGEDAWVIRVNDWPEDPTVFSLLVNDVEWLDFDGWSKKWNKPR